MADGVAQNRHAAVKASLRSDEKAAANVHFIPPALERDGGILHSAHNYNLHPHHSDRLLIRQPGSNFLRHGDKSSAYHRQRSNSGFLSKNDREERRGWRDGVIVVREEDEKSVEGDGRSVVWVVDDDGELSFDRDIVHWRRDGVNVDVVDGQSLDGEFRLRGTVNEVQYDCDDTS